MSIKMWVSDRRSTLGWVTDLNTDCTRPDCALRHRRQSKALRRGVWGTFSCAVALALAFSPAAARTWRAAYTFNAGHKHAWHKEKARQEKEHASKEPFGNMPKGPLQIIISIDQQKLYLYSDGTPVADATIATGVPRHPTPTGVFSVLEKERFHRSNIYSGAPMPYMQRITWSGVALHEGVNLGHPASHGCIRLPGEFAARLWVLRSVGARVVIARPELRPVEFADPHLFAHREKPSAPAASAAAPPAIEPFKTAQTIDASKTTDVAAPSIPLGSKAADDQPMTLRLHTVDPPVGDDKVDHQSATAADITTPSGPAASAPATIEPAASQAPAAAAIDPVPAATTQSSELAQPPAAAPASGDAASASPEAAPQTVPVPAPKPAAIAKSPSTKTMPVTIFISRKLKRLYVRQNFAPLFDATIAIDHPERPLGTHVFTALGYLSDGVTLRWNVISLPAEQPRGERAEKQSERAYKNRRTHEPPAKLAKPTPEPPVPTPQEALARIEIPPDVIEQISALIVPGSSLIVSDQGLGDETGEGTDFIVVTR
jgi:hypothetical protein